ncbi:hypothetical protein MUK42_32140 [Musa troglodytarum]|uniref:VQ domain-containing protein n=1 Tax=Musa troglodytarum TaxID=320322 RepID=A0A9E7FQE5_9LILI|nr:hypothetical protein MUK42_32140 [Musa troglodytarum]URD99308.1 hypothetical protein MUK42_32140 [Musa troglodytarum]
MSGEGTRVKIIETKFVETDATHFKSVVQSLTGKDARPPFMASESPSGSRRNTQMIEWPTVVGASGGRPWPKDPREEGKRVLNLEEVFRYLQK